MKLLTLELTALEPLIPTSGSSEGMAHSCLEYIPGSMLLGAFAKAWIHYNPHIPPDDSPVFQKLFLDGSVSWGNGLPLCAGNPTIPVPLCLMREKNMDGLPVAGVPVPACSAAVFNTISLGDEERLKEVYLAFLKDNCPEKATRLKDVPPKFKKLSAAFMDPISLRQPDTRQVWNVRVTLGKKRAARQGMLFGFAALARGTVFQAQILCEEECQEHLAALVESAPRIHIGHSRSSGYGLTAVKGHWQDEPAPRTIESDVFNLLLLSHYFPDPPWEDPLEALLKSMEDKTGAKPKEDKLSLAWEHLDGFNSHWRAWRNSRGGIAQGSVIRLRFPREITLPAFLTLGAGKVEGCGRICVNPPLLEKRVLASAAQPAPARRQKPAAPAPNLASPQWRILRERALARLAEGQASAWLEDQAWQEFLKTAEKLDSPSASQRANALGMDAAKFEKMLGKTPGKQWKAAIVKDPFRKDGNEHLSEVMRILLDPEKFYGKLQNASGLPSAAVMPGGEMTAREKSRLKDLSWNLFKRGLIRSWGKRARTSQADKEAG